MGAEKEAYDKFYSFLYRLCKWKQPMLSVELGTDIGRGAFVLCAGSDMGTVITADIGAKPPSTYIDYLAHFDNIRIITGTDSITMGRTWLMQGMQPSIDILHLDTEHNFSQVMQEYYTFRPLMRPGGVICFDDAHHNGVRQLLPEIGFPRSSSTTKGSSCMEVTATHVF